MIHGSRHSERKDFPSEVHAITGGLESILLDLRERQSGKDVADDSQLIVQSLRVVADRLVGVEKVAAEIRELLVGQRQEKEWYTTRELADLLGKSHYTIQERWCNDGRIECEKDEANGKWRIPGHEVRRLVAGGGLLPRHGGRAGKV
jgi:hypothetical protein